MVVLTSVSRRIFSSAGFMLVAFLKNQDKRSFCRLAQGLARHSHPPPTFSRSIPSTPLQKFRDVEKGFLLNASRFSSYHKETSDGVASGIGGAGVIFRQLLDYKSYTYTYLLADAESREAVLIDPVIETVDRDLRVVQELGLNLIFAANTHVHADHITGTGELKKRLPQCRSMIAEVSKAVADVKLKPGDLIQFGKFELETRSTPGHTNGCLSYVWHQRGMVFTGDALLIRGCGRTDFQEGDPAALYDSVHTQIFSLPQDFLVFPAHDYTGQTMSTVGEELRCNPRLTRSKSEFIEIMNKLSLPYPKQIDRALPANMVCGIVDDFYAAPV